MSRRAIAATTAGAGALLVVVGSLFPLYGVETVVQFWPANTVDTTRRMVALTPWELVQEPAPPPSADTSRLPVYGYGLVFAAVLAAAGAGLQLRSPLLAAVGRFGVLVAFGLVVGTVWTALETLRLLFGGSTPSGPLTTTREFVGSGTWVLAAAAVALLVGAVLAQDWPARAPRPAGAAVYQVDDDTPPFGIAIPVAEPDVPMGGPVPSTGPVPPVDDRSSPDRG